jgi:creatinine amidohydrolase
MKAVWLSKFPHEEIKAHPECLELVYVFVNPVEFHGPHLSLMTDFLISWGLAERLTPLVQKWLKPAQFSIGAVLDVGVDPVPGPGSVATTYAEVSQAVKRICKHLKRIGAQRVVFMTFHGSPGHAAALEDGVHYLRELGIPALNPANLLMTKMRDFDSAEYEDIAASISDAKVRDQIRRRGWTDFHGGLLETSVAMTLAPDSVSADVSQVPDCPDFPPLPLFQRLAKVSARCGKSILAREFEIAADAVAWSQLRPHPGYTGSPRFASQTIGEKIVSRIVTEYDLLIRKVFENGEPAPKPILQWTTAGHKFKAWVR